MKMMTHTKIDKQGHPVRALNFPHALGNALAKECFLGDQILWINQRFSILSESKDRLKCTRGLVIWLILFRPVDEFLTG